MKYFYRIGLLCVLVLGIYFCYRYVAVLKPEFSFDSLIYSSERKAEQPLVIQNITVDDNGTVLEMTEDVKENYEEASAVPETLTCDTELVIREYDKSTRKEESYKESIPEQYIGKNRNQMEEIANSYTAAPSLKDLEKGFVSMEIASFSPEKLVVLKKYYSDLSKEHFYLIAENGLITVYYSDMSSVYLYTDISLDTLSEELQQEILDKKYVESEEELYNFLESYTS